MSPKKPARPRVLRLAEAYSLGMQPSASWAGQLLECSYAFGKEFERGEAGEPARYGSAFHELLASCIQGRILAPADIASVAKSWHLADNAPDELTPHVRSAYEYLQKWLVRNEFKIDYSRVKGKRLIETAVALTPGVSGRLIDPHDNEHRYHGLVVGEQPGTLDYGIIPVRDSIPALVLDHKTGEEDFSNPLDKAQLLTLLAAVLRLSKRDEGIIGVLHARRRGMPKIYAERVRLRDLRGYERRLATALGRIGDGSMRPGQWCLRCPAQSVCPARDADLLGRAGDVLTGLTAATGALSKEGLTANDVSIIKAPASALSRERKLGLLYDVTRLGQRMIDRARAEIKNAVLQDPNLLPITPQGEYLTIRTYEKESLSKTSVVEAYGKLDSEKVLSKLRKDGAIKTTTVKALWPEKERGS